MTTDEIVGGLRAEIEGFRTSPLQDRIWRTARHARSVMVLAVSGAISTGRIEAALRAAVGRHEVLRTSFRSVPELSFPLQVIHGHASAGTRLSDLSEKDPAARETAVAAIVRAHREETWDPAGAPALRADLVMLSPTDRRLVLSLPALCADAGTLLALCREVAEGCGAPGPAPDDPPQYADVAEWIHDVLESSAAEAGRDYWATASGRAAPALVEPGETGGGTAPAGTRLRVSASDAELVDRAAAGLGESTEAFLLACWQLLLWRAAGQDVPTVGVLRDGRTHAELAHALGPLTRCVPLVGLPDLAEPLAALVRRTGENLRSHREWQEHYDPAAFLRSAGMAEDARFHEVFGYTDASATWTAGGTAFSVELLEAEGEPYACRLTCLRLPDGLTVELRRAPGAGGDHVLDGAILERLRTLALSAARRPDAPVGSLDWLGADELRAIDGFSDGAALEEPSGGTRGLFHERFLASARHHAERTALVFGDERLTYRELNERADRFAHRLAAAGIGPRQIVAVWAAPTPGVVAAVLGILKAGCAYLPLVPGESPGRASGILAGSGAVALVLDREPPPGVPLPPAGVLRTDEAAPPGPPPGAPDVTVDGHDLAYVIYTSGSTGTPKGVMVEHRSLDWFHRSMRQAVPLRRTSRPLSGLLNAPLAFDASVAALLLLLEGHCLHLVPEETRRDQRRLADYVATQRIEVLHCTPTQLTALTDAGLLDGQKHAPAVLLVAGEALPEELWERLREAPETRAYNFYGPTECTVNASGCEIGATPGRPVIGTPLPGASLRVLDPWLRPVGIGVPGEICVGGPGQARGYLARPGTTAERFVPDRLVACPGARLYRTGDLGRFLPDGTVEFLGRTDDQVKVRGFRVEPGEVEAALRQHPRVREAAVTARADGRSGRYLVAYCVPADGDGAPTTDELRDFLGGHLPDFMIPAVFTELAALPTTPSGKVDRAALPDPDAGRLRLSARYAPPRTEREEMLAAIWAAVLDVDRVGIDDNYFSLGGDSIRSIQLRSRAVERGLDFSVQQLVEHPTIRALSEVLHERERPAGLPAPQPFAMIGPAERDRLPGDVEDAYPLAKAQAGTVYEAESGEGLPVFHNVRSVRLRAALDEDALRRALADVAERHPVLRTSFDLARFSEPMQLVHRAAEIPLRVTDLRGLDTEQRDAAVTEYIENEKRHRFDWSSPPFLRTAAHVLADDSCQLTFTLHEAVFDGWSVALLLTEIFQRYQRAREGADEPPKPLRSAYQEFVALERAAMADRNAARFWSAYLGDAAPAPLSPGGMGTTPSADHRVLRVTLPPDAGSALPGLARSLGVPLKSLLLAVHLRVLSAVTGQDDVLTGVTVNGRCEAEDGERVVGQFLNTVPFRLAPEPDTWAGLVARVFRDEVAQLPHRRYPTALMQRERGSGRLFDTAFNFTHFHVYREIARAGGLGIEGGAFHDRTGLGMLADFAVDSATGDVNLVLNCNGLPEERIAVIGRCYATAVGRLIAAPHGRHDWEDLLSAEDRRRLLTEWNAAATPGAAGTVDVEEDADAVGLFEAFGRRSPQATAVACAGTSLTYGELAARADRLSRRLAARGVGHERLVALCGPRGIPLVTAVLAVLKAGGAYLPLDPDAPAAQTAELLRRLRPSAVLLLDPVPDDIRDALAAGARELDVPLMTEPGAAGGEASGTPAVRRHPPGLAVVLTTSGSTGSSKAVMLDHTGVVNHLRAKAEALGLGPASRIAYTARPTFVIAVWQTLAALTTGGCVEIIPDERANHPAELLRALDETGTTVAEIVPSVLSGVLDALEAGAAVPSRLAHLVATGEALPERLARRWRRLAPGVPLTNAYGSTESSDDVTHHFVGEPLDLASCAIGRPARNTRVYVLDDRMRPVPPGTTGQLCVAGRGLARGYHGDPAATATAFVPDPFGSGERLYLTGDLGYHGPDGLLHCLGRRDRQVKVNGVRIEPAEIEAVLARHPGVAEAVVTARQDGSGAARLTAYVVERPGTHAPPAAYAAHVRASLARPYVPSAVVTLAEIPVNRHGKVDEAALPEPAPEPRRAGPGRNAPRGPLEGELTRLFAELLPAGEVGPYDDFFADLGGDSLLAIQLTHRFRLSYGFDLPLRRFFEDPTVAGTALLVEEYQRRDDRD
ncbi:non-ribosomal peptide synthetase [Streptomyces tailanensis]|uniref:non-ribosomal peptide synthetase n=1 Tax=Streptomyces tailanensis TaxID=2569858 RepID=UPI00155AD2AB|nr:non-ribosomal peptide synthetase [Streptomyces tailanensis]